MNFFHFVFLQRLIAATAETLFWSILDLDPKGGVGEKKLGSQLGTGEQFSQLSLIEPKSTTIKTAVDNQPREIVGVGGHFIGAGWTIQRH